MGVQRDVGSSDFFPVHAKKSVHDKLDQRL